MIQKCDSISYNNSLSAKLAFKSDNADNMTAPDKNQKNNLQQNVETTIDNINTKIENEKKKKSNKIAIISACSAVTLSIIVALFNPSFSPKLATKIQTLRQNFLTRREKNKKNFVYIGFFRDNKMDGCGKLMSQECEKYGIWNEGKFERKLEQFEFYSMLENNGLEAYKQYFSLNYQGFKGFFILSLGD